MSMIEDIFSWLESGGIGREWEVDNREEMRINVEMVCRQVVFLELYDRTA